MRYFKKRRNYCRTHQKSNNNKSKVRKSKMLILKKKKLNNRQGNRRLKRLGRRKKWLQNIFKNENDLHVIL